ncbi:helix-turn-helix domain-containing protein [Devosia sp.]|uniref:helix-turn-helix domain-containing protein n=1 Tax=Devosia sp. TaxID=1871048 RepID=UPI0035B0BEC7
MGQRYRQFSVEERIELARLRAAGVSIRQIAAGLDRAPSSPPPTGFAGPPSPPFRRGGSDDFAAKVEPISRPLSLPAEGGEGGPCAAWWVGWAPTPRPCWGHHRATRPGAGRGRSCDASQSGPLCKVLGPGLRRDDIGPAAPAGPPTLTPFVGARAPPTGFAGPLSPPSVRRELRLCRREPD